MAGLPKQIVSIPLAGLQSKADPKAAAIGTASRMENVVVTRRTEGGVEARKRNGFASLTRNILGGGALASGRTAGVLNDELVLCDGLKAYSYSAVLAKWLARGLFQHISVAIRRISGDQGQKKPNVCTAYAAGYACHVSSPQSSSGLTTIYVEDTTTGEIIAASSALVAIYRARVVAVGADFYIFSWNGVNAIECQKISGAAPTTLPSSVSTVATNASTGGVFDVQVSGSQMLVAYENITPGLTLKVWTTGMTAGSSVTNAIDPSGSVGFLVHDYSDGFGYVAVATLTETHVLRFDATTLAISPDTTIETVGSPTDFPQITGYRNTVSAKSNVFWTVGGGERAKIRGACGATAYDVQLAMGLASKPFKVGTKWYLVAAYQKSGTEFATNPSQYGQRRTFLLQLDEDATGANGSTCVAGYLMANDSGGTPRSRSCLPSVSTTGAGRVVFATAGLESVAPVDASAQVAHFSLVRIELDWSGAGLGRPVVYNGVLHLPGAASQIYDGHFVIENGFYVLPEVPVAAPTQTTGGALAVLGTYQYCFVFAHTDKSGRRWRSAPGPVFSVTLTGSNNKIAFDVGTLRPTATSARYNTNSEVTGAEIEVYRTQDGLPVMYLNAVIDNNALADSIAFEDIMADDSLELNELLYTKGGILDHVSPPAVKVLHRHGDRLFAIVGDGSIWHTKVSVEGKGAEWSDDFRFTVEEGEGAPVALGTVDATLAIFKRNRTLLIQGTGPDEQGNNEFPRAQALGDDAGALGPGSVFESSLGVLVRSPKGWQVLGRDLALQPVEALAAHDALTPVFGASPDDRALVVLPTGGDALVYDWQLGQFYTWTGDSSYLAGACAARWRNTLVVLQADGTVKQQSSSSYADDGAPITMRVEGTWTDLKNGRVYEAAVTAEYMASTTVSVTISRDLDPATAQTKSIAVTTGTKGVVAMRPDSGRAAQVRYLIEESSATEGVRLSKIELEVGVRPGAQKRRQAQLMG
jgi:hypothetical protein